MSYEPTPEELIDHQAEGYFHNAGFAVEVYPELVASDPYLNGLVAQLEDVNTAILRRIKQLVAAK